MTDYDRNSRRGKPQRKLYTPGSGPLRKTGEFRDDVPSNSESLYSNDVSRPLSSSRSQDINCIADELKKINMSDKPQGGNSDSRNGGEFRRKPGSEIYVPKRVAEHLKKTQSPVIRPLMSEDEFQYDKRYDNNEHRMENKVEKSGRGRNGRHKKGPRGDQGDLRSGISRSRESVNDDFNDNRFVRHGSEPRSLPLPQERIRDTRSMEPTAPGVRVFAQERLTNKPPVVYQQKKPAFQVANRAVNPNLPPRLQKKTVAEREAEEKANKNLLQDQDFRPPPPVEWSRTLPGPRGRGRGRLRPEDSDRFRRPPTPDHADGRRGSHDSSAYLSSNGPVGNRPSGLEMEEKENRKQPNDERRNSSEFRRSSSRCSEESQPRAIDNVTLSSGGPNVVLDWAAEVDRVEQEEFGHLSRANSKESLKGVSRGHKKKKKRRSASRGRGGQENVRKGSFENTSNHSRNNSVERESQQRNWRERQFPDVPRSRQNSYCDNPSRHSSPDRYHNRSRKNSSCDNHSRQSSLDRKENWRQRGAGNGPTRQNNERRLDEPKSWRSEGTPPKDKPAGILVLPSPMPQTTPLFPTLQIPKQSAPAVQRSLYNPSNPDKPIIVPNARSTQEIEQNYLNNCSGEQNNMYMVPSGEMISSQTPLWYNPYKENFQQCRNPQLIRGIAQADFELQYLLSSGELLNYWEHMQQLRYQLKDALRILLVSDLRFCEAENVEQHLWKILYYNVIELLRKHISEKTENMANYKMALITILDDGLEFYEKLLVEVENSNKIKLENYLNAPAAVREGLGFAGLALIAAQKIYLCLGDLARYKEHANETCNYGLSRQWYMRAHQINPKNGRPYNQLALLAMYTKRKLDAVYYYMRCLMSSNPMHNAREGLITLFDDNRKKFEVVDRRKKEERAAKEREKMKEKEGVSGFRREIWIHPAGGKNVHRTTSTCLQDVDSEEEELAKVSNVDLNKMFCTTYLHVLGKLYTKIGMESLAETAVKMLREFRALLQHSPLPLNSTRFLQLFSLNMFAIEVTTPKADMSQSRDGCYRSAAQESALVVSLQMFNVLLERFAALLQEHLTRNDRKDFIPPDCHVILPALKVWCDWMTTHVDVWNPPPACLDYRVGPPGDCWNRIACLVTLLLKLDFPRGIIVEEKGQDLEPVYLPEDATLSGFTPLMANATDSVFVHKSCDMELAQMVLRLNKIEFFGQIFLCGLDPPILKLHKKEDGESEYISIVDIPGSQEEKTKSECGGQSENEVCLESMSSSDESDDSGKATGVDEDEGDSLQCLLAKKGRLEKQARKLQARKTHFQKALMAEVLTEMEIRPHDLVPDTNCFINCLSELENLIKLLPHPQHPYVIMVPLVVMNELEGLSRGCKPSQSVHHSAMVRETAKEAMALFQTRHPALRTVTTKGTVLNSSIFIHEEDVSLDMKNDDKILATCVNLSKAHKRDEIKEGGRRKLYRNVVLLTDDRSLRLKAISKDMPVRTLPDFIKWAGLG